MWMTIYIFIYIVDQPIGIMVRVFANGLGDWGSIPGRVISKTQNMVLDASMLNTQHYKVHIKGKMEQSKESVEFVKIVHASIQLCSKQSCPEKTRYLCIYLLAHQLEEYGARPF